MEWSNMTTVTEFVLLGLSPIRGVQIFLFVFFCILYVSSIFSNFLILVTIIKNEHLFSSPMFYLLAHLAFLDLCLSSFAMPRALVDFLTKRQAIAFYECMAQIFFLHFFGGTEIFLLMVMAYDRYVAICHPFHYATILCRRNCVGLVLLSWGSGLLHTSVQLGFTISAPYCGPNLVDSFFCDVPQVIKLACTDPYPLEIMMLTNSGVISLMGFFTVLASYGLILIAIRSRGPSEGTSKAISTCSSHFIVVTLYFGPCLFIYLRPYAIFNIDKVLAVFYTTITPFLNPAIYALKSKEMKAAMERLLKRRSGQISA